MQPSTHIQTDRDLAELARKGGERIAFVYGGPYGTRFHGLTLAVDRDGNVTEFDTGSAASDPGVMRVTLSSANTENTGDVMRDLFASTFPIVKSDDTADGRFSILHLGLVAHLPSDGVLHFARLEDAELYRIRVVDFYFAQASECELCAKPGSPTIAPGYTHRHCERLENALASVN
jgi:hypothetical protein